MQYKISFWNMGMPLATMLISLISFAFSKHVEYQYFIFSAEILLIAMIHVVARHLELAIRETCWKTWSILLLKSKFKLGLCTSRVVQLVVYDLNCKLKLYWNNWWLLTTTNHSCWCSNWDLVWSLLPNETLLNSMFSIASWIHIQGSGLLCNQEPL